jgi:TonB family protein
LEKELASIREEIPKADRQREITLRLKEVYLLYQNNRFQEAVAATTTGLASPNLVPQAAAQLRQIRDAAQVQLRERLNQVQAQLAQVEKQAVEQTKRDATRAPVDSATAQTGAIKGVSTVTDPQSNLRVAAVSAAKIYAQSEVDVIPSPTLQTAPQYPEELQRARVGGTVTVRFVVDENGDVQDARAVDSTDKRFESAALDAVRKWKFKPGRKGGKPVDTQMELPINFHLPSFSTSKAPAP